jgi:hypothetical protein
MNVRRSLAGILSVSVFAVGLHIASRAQVPEVASNAASVKDNAEPGPRNLKVLPKDTSEADVILLMIRYGQELGVQCAFCHAEDPQTQQVDFVSDENPRKQTARVMIGILRDLNTKYLAQVGDQ